MENKIKEIRVELDSLTQLIKLLARSRENSLAITSLELSKMWLGKVLKELGTENPYPESKNPENEKIEPTADSMIQERDSFHYDEYQHYSHIKKVKYIRFAIEAVENKLKLLTKSGFGLNTGFAYTHLYDSMKYCIESGMWLGMELGRIRDVEESEKKQDSK